MIDKDKVNEIWNALEVGKLALVDHFGDEFIGMGKIVDLIVECAQQQGAWSREEILEAWLYQTLEQVARSAGVTNRLKG